MEEDSGRGQEWQPRTRTDAQDLRMFVEERNGRILQINRLQMVNGRGRSDVRAKGKDPDG